MTHHHPENKTWMQRGERLGRAFRRTTVELSRVRHLVRKKGKR